MQNNRIAFKSPPHPIFPLGLICCAFQAIPASYPNLDCWTPRLDAPQRQKTGNAESDLESVSRVLSAAVSSSGGRVSSANNRRYFARNPSPPFPPRQCP